MKRAFLPIIVLALSACGTIQPIHINSDPNQESLERLEDRTEQNNVDAFIADHPELDAETRKGLRDGTISRHEALERLKVRR